MGRSLTNNFGLAYTFEDASGVPGTTWYKLEPNSVDTFGAEITTVPRNPISPERQRRKGAITDLNSSVSFESDLTISAFRDFAEAFAFATAKNSIVTEIVSTSTTATTYVVPTLSGAQTSILVASSLIYATGFNTPANNGLKAISTAAGTAITVTGNQIETAPASARVSFAGYRVPTGDSATWTWSAPNKQATLTSTGKGTILTAQGIVPGQFVHIGSQNPTTGAIQNAFENSNANDMYGYARVVSVSANDIVFDKVDPALQFTDGTAPSGAVDILFGQYIRNVPSTSPEYLERYVQIEATFVGLDNPSGDMYSYSVGNLCNTLGWSLPLTDKATMTIGMVGKDTQNPTNVRKAGAATALVPTHTTAFNTSADIARLRVTDVDEDGLTTDFKSVNLTINNNVGPEKVLGVLGAKYMNLGNLEVDFDTQIIFTDAEVINKIRSNETVTFDFIIKNDNGAIAVDIPSLTLGGGSLDLPVNESILLNVTGSAFRDNRLGTSIGISLFPVVPL